MPDVTILLKVKPVISGDRIRNRKLDRIEQETSEFHQAVYNGYEKLENDFPDRIIAVDAARSIEEICSDIINHVSKLIGQKKGEKTDYAF